MGPLPPSMVPLTRKERPTSGPGVAGVRLTARAASLTRGTGSADSTSAPRLSVTETVGANSPGGNRWNTAPGPGTSCRSTVPLPSPKSMPMEYGPIPPTTSHRRATRSPGTTGSGARVTEGRARRGSSAISRVPMVRVVASYVGQTSDDVSAAVTTRTPDDPGSAVARTLVPWEAFRNPKAKEAPLSAQANQTKSTEHPLGIPTSDAERLTPSPGDIVQVPGEMATETFNGFTSIR